MLAGDQRGVRCSDGGHAGKWGTEPTNRRPSADCRCCQEHPHTDALLRHVQLLWPVCLPCRWFECSLSLISLFPLICIDSLIHFFFSVCLCHFLQCFLIFFFSQPVCLHFSFLYQSVYANLILSYLYCVLLLTCVCLSFSSQPLYLSSFYLYMLFHHQFVLLFNFLYL